MVFFISQCKILTYTRSPKEASKDFQPHEFENLINTHLQNGWKLVNCESNSLGQVSQKAGMYFIAYLVKE
jgi:hypothetical protein